MVIGCRCDDALNPSLLWILKGPTSAPGSQAPIDHKGTETLLAQQMRHASARCLSAASTVQVHVFIPGELLYFGAEIVGFNSNRAGYADSASTVVTMAAHICEQYLSRALGLQLSRQRRYLNPWYNAIGAVLPVQRNAVTDKRNHRHDDHDLDCMSRRAKSANDLRYDVTKDKSDRPIRERVGAGTQEIQPQKLKEWHFHASSQRRGHRTPTYRE